MESHAQLDRTLGLAIDHYTDRFDYEPNILDYVMFGALLRNTRLFRKGDFVTFLFDNGGGERWRVTGVSSKGYVVRGFYLHFNTYYPNIRRRVKKDGLWRYVNAQARHRKSASVAIIADQSGQPVKFPVVFDKWQVDPTVQRAIVETLRAGSVVSR